MCSLLSFIPFSNLSWSRLPCTLRPFSVLVLAIRCIITETRRDGFFSGFLLWIGITCVLFVPLACSPWKRQRLILDPGIRISHIYFPQFYFRALVPASKQWHRTVILEIWREYKLEVLQYSYKNMLTKKIFHSQFYRILRIRMM